MLKWLPRMKLSYKFIGAFLFLTIILVASNMYALQSMKSIESGSSNMYNKNLVVINELARMSDAINQFNSSLSGYLLIGEPDARKAQTEKIEANKQEMAAMIQRIDGFELTREEETKFKLFAGLWNSYFALMDQIIGLADQNDLDYAISVYEKQMLVKAQSMKDLFRDITAINQREADARYRDSVRLYESVRITMWAIAAFSLIVTVAVGWLMQRSVMNPVRELLKGFKTVEQGDLSEPLRLNRADEFGTLADGFNRMRESISAIVMQTKRLTATLADVSDRISGNARHSGASSKEISEGLQHAVGQSREEINRLSKDFIMLKDIMLGLRQMAASVDEISRHSSEMEEASRDSQSAIRDTLDKMNELKQSSVRTGSVIRQLNGRSADIGGIVGTIEKIAKDTNMLAINASIEASRTGAAGKGFAVIAQEVRKLADTSKNETRLIAEEIEEMLQDTSDLLMSSDAWVADMQDGQEKVGILSARFRQIDGRIQEVNNRIQDVTATIEEIAAGGEEIQSSVQRMERYFDSLHKVTITYSGKSGEQLRMMEEVNASVAELDRISRELSEAAGRFVTVDDGSGRSDTDDRNPGHGLTADEAEDDASAGRLATG